MHKNLMRILADKKITHKAFAEFLEVSEKTAQNKIYGRTEFTLDEAVKVCTFICPEYKMDYVFARVEDDFEAGMGAGLLAEATA